MDSDSSEEEEEVKMEKANYPVGWDGNPIPFWLYKLHGLGMKMTARISDEVLLLIFLGIEYKCEICGNFSYWGPRAFDRHFQEWRHNHGMKCLRLENTKEFHHVTKIQDALELDKRLKELVRFLFLFFSLLVYLFIFYLLISEKKINGKKTKWKNVKITMVI